MRRLLLLVLVACGDNASSVPAPDPIELTFGPYELAPGQEVTNQCVSFTLDNDEPLYVNQVELTTGPGFHHSNWFWVPESRFGGGDGTWRCSDRGYDEAVAGVEGAVVFAQSTQAQHEVQAFPAGVATVIPPRSRIIAGTHLLNATDATIQIPLTLRITPIAEPTTLLSGMAFENEAIALPPHRTSRFTLECDVGRTHQDILSRPPDFAIYYALPHYHELGKSITLEGVRADGSSTMIYETAAKVGDALGGTITPAFSMAGYQKLRFSCTYDNPRDQTVRWGVGDQEMCVFLAFTDSTHNIAGGKITAGPPTSEVDTGDVVEFTHDCSVLMSPANR